MLVYTYDIIKKHGFRYIDYNNGLHDEYFTLGDIELTYNRLHHHLTFNYLNEGRERVETYCFHEDSTDDELDRILAIKLRKLKLKQLIK